MPSQQETSVNSVVVPYVPEESPAWSRRLADHRVPVRWRTADRSAHAPHIVAVTSEDGEGWTAAALVTARPETAYLKIVDAVGDVRAAVAAVVAHARLRGSSRSSGKAGRQIPRTPPLPGSCP